MPDLSRRELLAAGAAGLTAAALAGSASAATPSGGLRSFHYDRICGTSLDVWFTADRETEAEARVLAEVDRLTAVFSLYHPNSELSRFNQRSGTVAVSPDLMAVLKLYEEWQVRTAGALNPRVGTFVSLWAFGEGAQVVPEDSVLAAGVNFITRPDHTLNTAALTVSKSAICKLDLNAIAKGYIVGRMAEVLKDAGATSGLVNLGGDMAAFGLPSRIAVQDPFNPAENAPPLGGFELRDAAVATSGGSERFYTIQGRKFSHLIDPRSGQPATAVASATVVAPTSTTANALATTLGVMGIEEGMRLVATVPGAEALLVDRDGKQFKSAGMPFQPMFVNADEPKGAWPTGFQTSIALELPALGGGRYRRPYVAVWIEDATGKAVRTIEVWGNSPKYTKDLTDWWKFAKSDQALVRATTRPTRGPGKYTLVWNGKDDAGKALPQGTYTVKVEVHREHGKHLRQSGKIECGAEGATVKLDKNDESGEVVVTYGAKK